MQIRQSRRHFLASASSAAAAGLLGAPPSLADEGPLETTSIRIYRDPSICVAPVQIADDLLRAEGFTDIRYVRTSHLDAVARREVDFSSETAAWVVSRVDAGEPITALAGIHPGCYELFVHEPLRTISDLRGRRVGVPSIGGSGHLLLMIMVAQVGLDPHQDIEWVTTPTGTPMEMFAERQVDAFLGFPPEPQELRARQIGRVLLKRSRTDHGRSIFAASRSATRTSSAIIRSPPSASFAPCTKRPRGAPSSPSGLRKLWSMPNSPTSTITRSRC